MKKITVFFALAILLSCNRDFKQEKAEDLVRKYLVKTLSLPSFYQPVKFSRLDSVYPNYEQTKEHKQLQLKLEKLEYLSEEKRGRDLYGQQIVELQTQDSLKKAAFKVQFGGWSLLHDFKGKDGNQIVELTYKFFFDKNTQYVTDVEFVK